MTNHQAHAKRDNPDGRAQRRFLRARGQRFLTGPFQESRRNLRSQGYVLIDSQDEEGKPIKTWKMRTKKGGMGVTRAPSSKRLSRRALIDRLAGRNVVQLATAGKGPKQRGPQEHKSVWQRAKDLGKKLFSGKQRGRG